MDSITLYEHYIRIDSDNNIIKGFSDAFEVPQDSDICINEHGGRHFELFGQINPPLENIQGVPLYHYINGAIIAKTSEGLEAEIPTTQPSVPTLEERQAALERAFMELAGEFYG